MNFIKKVIEKQDSTLEELINCFEQKFDGERIENEYTIFISFPVIKRRDMIRADESDLKGALKKVLTRYVNEGS